MKRTVSIIMIQISIMFLLCACGNDTNAYRYQPTDVSAKNEEAQLLYDNGEYADSFALFLEAMQEEPKNVEARIGIVKCQIALEDYNMAVMNLNSAIEVSPHEEELYDLYLEVSKLTDNMNTARNAIDLAKRYHVEGFLEKIPHEPVLGYESGKYSQRIEVTVDSPETDAEVYFSVQKTGGYSYYDMAYKSPWLMTSGETKVFAYCMKDGIPSEVVEATYICEYEPSAIEFEDSVMEQLVRITLDKPEGEITDVDCEQITDLDSYDLYTGEIDYEEYQKLKMITLNDLQYFPNLQRLWLREQSEIDDYSQVALCPLVQNLYINGTDLESIDFVTELPYLYQLELPYNQISDLSPIVQCKNMRYLYIQGNPVNDLSDLTALEDLYTLSLSSEQAGDFDLLKQMENLRSVNIYCRGNDDLSALGELTQLNSLNINNEYWREDYDKRTYISDISYLGNLTNLTSLSISGMKDLSQIGYLKGLVNLQNLYLYNREDTDAEADQDMIMELQQALPKCNINY